jgi:hypothetical protein
MTEEFKKVLLTDSTVHWMTREGYSQETIICQLVKEKEGLWKRVAELELLAPRKVTINGETFVYRAPAHLIPEITT